MYGFYVRDINTEEVIYNLTDFDSMEDVIAEIRNREVPSGEVTIYSYVDFEDPNVEQVEKVLLKDRNNNVY